MQAKLLWSMSQLFQVCKIQNFITFSDKSKISFIQHKLELIENVEFIINCFIYIFIETPEPTRLHVIVFHRQSSGMFMNSDGVIQ